MKLAACVLVGSLLLGVSIASYANPTASEVIDPPSMSVCEQGFVSDSALIAPDSAVPELKIFPRPDEPREQIPSYPYLITAEVVPDILHHLEQVFSAIELEPRDVEASRQAHHLLTRLRAWLRGPLDSQDLATYVLHLAEPNIGFIHGFEKTTQKEIRFSQVKPILPQLIEVIEDVELNIGVRAQALLIKQEFDRMQIEVEMRKHATALQLMDTKSKWQELVALELALAKDDLVPPAGRIADILKLSALYVDSDVLKRLMQPDERNGWGARLNVLDKHIAEAIAIYDHVFFAQLPAFLSDTVETKIHNRWRIRQSVQTVYFKEQLSSFRRTYEPPLPLSEPGRLIDRFLIGFNPDLFDANAYKHIAVAKEIIEKAAIRWKSRDPLEKAEAGRALWLAIRLITVL